MRTILIYCSVYGSTRQYAGWIAESTGAELATVDEAAKLDISGFDRVILGSNVFNHGASMKMRSFAKDNLALLKGKGLALFLVGGAPPSKIDKENLISNSLPKELSDSLTAFGYMHGRMDYDKMSFKDKMIMRIGSILMPGKVRIEKFDDVKKENITSFVKELS